MEKFKRIPINGTFELTARCNLSCKMCYIRVDDKRIKKLGYKERTAQEWIDMAQQAFDAGTISLLLTGGEPMLRSDFCEIYEAIAKMGFVLTLYTNATMVTPKAMEVLKKYPPHTVGVTIYGACEETYKKVCGSGNTYNKMIEGLEQLLTLPSNIEIRTTIIQDNIDDLKSIEKFTKSIERKNVTFKLNRIVLNSVRGSITDPTTCRLTPKQSVEMYCQRYIDSVNDYVENKEYRNKVISENEQYNETSKKENKSKKETLYGCEAGCSDYSITWDGKMIPCSLMGKYYTNPFEEGLQKAWDRLEEVIEPPYIPQKCLDCKYRDFCSTCPANRYCETGDESGIPTYLCEEAKAFYKILK